MHDLHRCQLRMPVNTMSIAPESTTKGSSRSPRMSLFIKIAAAIARGIYRYSLLCLFRNPWETEKNAIPMDPHIAKSSNLSDAKIPNPVETSTGRSMGRSRQCIAQSADAEIPRISQKELYFSVLCPFVIFRLLKDFFNYVFYIFEASISQRALK